MGCVYYSQEEEILAIVEHYLLLAGNLLVEIRICMDRGAEVKERGAEVKERGAVVNTQARPV